MACWTAVALFAAPDAAAAIYKYVDKHGRVHFTDQPEHPGYKKLVMTWKGWREPSYDYRQFRANQKRFSPLIAEAAAKHSLPVPLVHAVVTAESAYDPDALSSAGALGLMQLMPATASRFGVTNRSNPRANVFAGTRYLKLLLDTFDNDMRLAVAAYNAGESAVIRHGHKVPPYPETRKYVKRVLAFYQKYRKGGIPN
jgi:soluble lytic murein transglycosylase-like protein